MINAQLEFPSAKGILSSGISTVPPLSRGVTASSIVVAGLLAAGALTAGAAIGVPPPLTVVVFVVVVPEEGGVD
ncbi:hypothetical protein [Anaerofustis stercorihominis]|uniref:hypothetical protein n=1 Tax=Anaerofustis stercorihominis TaxID=214853 RepID=UPI00214AEDC0|nr:hypothetical protein [Anaerofustis stercorihominis]MCR2033123.1 hypothetical protein [Anaerofustis stercorihominis]